MNTNTINYGKRVFHFGKYAIASKRKVNAVDVTMELRETYKGPELSICGTAWNAPQTDIVMGGQCLDELARYLHNNPTFRKLHRLWKDWRLNGMDASANEAQRQAVDEIHASGIRDYGAVCDELRRRGLYEVEVDGHKCAYGAEWYYRPIPTETMTEIQELLSMAV